MSLPPIDYTTAILLFSKANAEDSYINISLETTPDKTKSASLEVVCALTDAAIKGIHQQSQDRTLSLDELEARAKSVRNYLLKAKESLSVEGSTHKIYMDLFSKTETELKQLSAMGVEQELKDFPEDKIMAIVDDEDFLLKFDEYGIKSDRTKIRIAKQIAKEDGLTISEMIQEFQIQDQEGLIEIAKIAEKRCPIGKGFCNLFKNFGIKNEKVRIEFAKRAAKREWYTFSKFIKNFNITDQVALIEIAKIAEEQSLQGYQKGIGEFIQNFGIKDEKVRIEFAKRAAVRGYEFSKFIKNYTITDQEALVEIATLAAGNYSNEMPKYIQNYGFTDQNILTKIAELTLKNRSAVCFSQNIQNFGITNKRILIKLAEMAVSLAPWGLPEFIQNYGIDDQEVLAKIAKSLTVPNEQQVAYADRVSKYIHNFGIKNEETCIQIAESAAKSDGGNTSLYIKNYKISDKEALIRIAKLAAEQDGDGTSRYIQNYGITDPAELSKIALISAKSSKGNLSEFIQNYGIKDENVLITIAKIMAQKNGEGISKHIKNYGFTKESTFVEIAELAAEKNGEQTSLHIQNYGISQQRDLIKIAKIAAKQNGDAVSYYIQKYNIKDENDLNEIAIIAATSSKRSIIERLQIFGITNKEVILTIVELGAQKDGLTIAENIKKFKFSPKELIKIARFCVQQNAETSRLIKNFGITDEGTLIDIAFLSAKRDAGITSEYIKNYGIKNQKALVDIAKLAATKNGHAISYYIRNYEIEDEDERIAIAKLSAQNDGEKTSQLIEVYSIDNERALIEIAKLAVQQDGAAASSQIDSFGIQDQTALIEIAKLAIRQDIEAASHFENYGIEDRAARHDVFLYAYKINPVSTLSYIQKFNLDPILSNLSQFSSIEEFQKAFVWPEEFTPIFEVLRQTTPSQDDILCLNYLANKLIQKPPHLKDPKIWLSILKCRDKKMRYELIDLAFSLDDKQVESYKLISSPDYLQLPALFFSRYSQNEKESKAYFDLFNKRTEFRDGMMQKALLDTLHALLVQHNFETEPTTALLKMALVEPIKVNLFSIQGILSCGGADRLKKEALTGHLDLDEIYKDAFISIIPMNHIKDFSKKCDETFGSCAIPSAPLTYAGRLRRLPKEEQDIALQALAEFVRSVIETEYKQNRYLGSDHLKMIFEKQSSLKTDWPTDDTMPFKALQPPSSSKTVFNPLDFLKTKIFKDKHLPKDKYPDIYQYLETGDLKVAEGLNKTLGEMARKSATKGRQIKDLNNALALLKDIDKVDNVEKRFMVLKNATKQLKEFSEFADIIKGIGDIPPLPRKESGQVIDILGRAQTIQKFMDQLNKAVTDKHRHLSIPDELQQRLQFQKDLIDLCKTEKKPLPQQIFLLKKIRKELVLFNEKEFSNDVVGEINALEKQVQSYDKYSLINTDRFDLMLLSGTELPGSCQRIDGDPILNKCLLAYPMDGKNRIIAVLDSDKKLVARSILRLLWDPKNNRPALMQERIYSNDANPRVSSSLDEFAKIQAKKLGVPLYIADAQGTGEALQSFGSVAPWEYVDSAEGVHPLGQFIISKTRLVYDPNKVEPRVEREKDEKESKLAREKA